MSEYNNLPHSVFLHLSPISWHIMIRVPVSPLYSFFLFPSFHLFSFPPSPHLNDMCISPPRILCKKVNQNGKCMEKKTCKWKWKIIKEWKSLSCVQFFEIPWTILQARVLEWVTFPFSRALSNLGIKPRSPALQADSLTTELWKHLKLYGIFNKRG